MNVQTKRESLKQDVQRVLSTRPDGIPLDDLWTEVSRELGYEIKGKDYLVPRLSYFLYLWGGDFKITENKIFLKEDTYHCTEGHATASTSTQSYQVDSYHTSQYSIPDSGNNFNTQINTSYQPDASYSTGNKPSAMDLLKRTGSHTASSNVTYPYESSWHGAQQNPNFQGSNVNPEYGHDQRYNQTRTDMVMPEYASYQQTNPYQSYQIGAEENAYEHTGYEQSTDQYDQAGTSFEEMRKEQGNNKPVTDQPAEADLTSTVGSSKEQVSSNYLSDDELANLRASIIKKLDGCRNGIKCSKLSVRLQGMQRELEKVTRHWGSFLDFLTDQMSDVLFVDKSKACLNQYYQPAEEVVDLTNEDSAGPSTYQNNHVSDCYSDQQQRWQHNQDHSGLFQQWQQQPAQGFNPGIMAPSHIQQRNFSALGEFVDLNMKPIEKKEFEKKEIVVMPLNIPRNIQPRPDFVDGVARECIDILSQSNEFVMAERVEKMLFQKFQIHHLRQIGVNHISNIPCIFELNRLLNKVHGYVMGFVKTRPVCTLYELRDALKQYIGNVEDFSQLKIGPLQRSPVVFQHFKFPPDQEEIPEITSIDVLEHFRNYMQQKNLWGSKPDLEPFLDYLVEQYKAESAYYLGVRIISLPLAAGILKKANWDAVRNRRHMFEYYKDLVRQDIEEAFRKLRASMLQSGDGEEMEIRKHYVKMRPDDVIMEVFEKFNFLMANLYMTDTGRAQQRKMGRIIDSYIGLIRGDLLCRDMFHLAICMSYNEVEEAVVASLNPTTTSTPTLQEETTNEGPVNEVKIPPRKDKLIELVKIYIERCLNAGSLSLTHLDRIEEKLLEEFDFADFHLMGYGRFLQFLITDNKQTLEEGGGLVLGSSSGGAHDNVFTPEQTDLQEFIKQCKACNITQPAEIEAALCKHYGVKEVRHLGYGNITRLLSHADKRRLGAYSEFTVYYQSTLTRLTGISEHHEKVGVLGHQTRDLAKICLHNCPLLEDLAAWSQWSLVFEPELGKLKDFVQKYGGVTNKPLDGGRLATLDFLALETKPGVLLKIVSNTSPELVAQALERRDIFNFCGHLVSMVIAYKGINNLPKALLTGHVKTALLQLHAADPLSETPGAPTTIHHENSACQFVLQCLLRLPTKICVDIADDMFLSPLGQVVGSTKFKQLLVQLCSTVHELNCLTELGCLLGIQEWTDTVSQKCVLAESSIQKITPDVEELFVEDEQDQVDEDEEENSETESEDLDDILGDDPDIENITKDMKVTNRENKVNTSNRDDITSENIKTGKDTDKDKEETIDETNDDVTMESKSTEVHLRTCEEIINEIRKEEFGVGIQLSEDGHRLMKVQQERLGRSLDRLSKDLYSKDTHFVLELVQNADDNSYHDDLLSNTNDVCPSVKFVIDDERVCVRNNELGFQERDIRALCDVGRSTKGKHKFGYIDNSALVTVSSKTHSAARRQRSDSGGQKGIGFKSVFRVTDTPEIHSNGYHIKFDVNSGPMGYILPHWLQQTDAVDDNWKTNIILTLKPDMLQQARTLAARFNDIHPSLLLFLHRLREISIENKVENSIQTMRRRDVSDTIIEIQHTGGLDRWLVIKKMLDATKISSQAKSGADVESTEIALAFPIKSPTHKTGVQVMPAKQLVFAFLPLRSYGFRFIVQGDFDVPSSREDVDRDSSWNQWLRNEIHTLFLDSLEMFKSHQDFSNIEAVISYLQFVPMEDEILDFFKPVALDILKKLKARPCVPTQPNSQGVVSWKIPSQTVRVRDPLVRSVITADLLHEHLNLHYLHSDVASMLNPTLTSCLGIETLTSEHLFQVGKAMIVEMDGCCESVEKVLLISQWLACVYRSLDEFHEDQTTLSSLQTLRMLPLSDGKLVSLHENTVFIPVNITSDTGKMDTAMLSHLLNDVNCLHPLLMKTTDDEVNGQVHKLLTRLGVKQLTPFDVIHHHIIPVLKSGAWKDKSEVILVSYISYIKTQTDRQSTLCNLEELKDIVQIVTNKGIQNPKHSPVHFSPQYGTTVNLQHTFPGYDWTVVEPVYLPPQCSQLIVLSWHDFFVKMGVEDFFCIQKREVCLKKEELESSIWKSVSELWPQGETEYIIQDFYSEELDTLITDNKYPSGERYTDQMKALCLLVESLWDKKLSVYAKSIVCDRNERILKETFTSFGILLQTSCWLPAVHYKCAVERDGKVTQSRTVEIHAPASVYIHTDNLNQLLSNKVLYLDVQLTLKSTFHQFLELKNSVSIETMKDYLLEWCARPEKEVPGVFCTSLTHMKQVYGYLGNQLSRGDLQNLLLNHPVYFVPSKLTHTDDLVVGKMLNRNEIWLADKTGLFDKHRGILEEFHSEICKKRTVTRFYGDTPELMNLFRQDGKVDQQPQIEEYIELLSLLCTTSTPKDLPVLTDVLYIFTTIGQTLTHPPEAPDEKTVEMILESMKEKVKKKMQKEKVLPTKKGIWVSLNDGPMISDNREWEKMFVGKEKIHFLDLEIKQGQSHEREKNLPVKKTDNLVQTNMVDVFMNVCGINRLSECVKMEVTSGLTEPCLALQAYFHRIVPTIQQYLMARFMVVYRNLEDKNTKQMFEDSKFYQTEKLEVAYRIHFADKDMIEVQREKCVITPPIFYFHKHHVNAIPDVNREIARHFSGGNSGCNTALRSFLSELYNIQSGLTTDSVEMLLQRHEADSIVIHKNEAWQVAAPVLPEPEPAAIDDFLLDSTSDEQHVEERKESSGMKAWPPISSEGRSAPGVPPLRSNPPTSNVWPPPQIKEYMRSVKDLPSNIRIAGPDEQSQVDESKYTTSDLQKQTEGSEVAIQMAESHDRPEGEGQGQIGSHGNTAEAQGSVITTESLSVATRKRKLSESENAEELQDNKRIYGDYNSSLDRNLNSALGNNTDSSVVTQSTDNIVKHYGTADNFSRTNDGSIQNSDRRIPNITGDPIWTQTASEYTLDELATGLQLPRIVTLIDSGEGDSEIGRWGEKLVAAYFQQQKEAGHITDFIWNNDGNEMGAPYDFVVQFVDESGPRENFIEVKSTISDDKEMFEISVQQIKFAEEKKGNFHIYRVFNAGNPDKVRLARLFDLSLRLSQKQVKLCLVI